MRQKKISKTSNNFERREIKAAKPYPWSISLNRNLKMMTLSVYIVISHDSEIQLVVLNFMPIHKTDLVRSCHSLSSCNIQLIS